MAYSFVFYGLCVFMNMCVSLSYEYHSCIQESLIYAEDFFIWLFFPILN